MTRAREVPRVVCTLTVLTALEASARRAAPNETGGILTGWREGSMVVVQHALRIDDATAQRATYQRRHQAAEEALIRHLRHVDDPRVGYVGEWHTHPLLQPPSETDWASLRSVARVAGGPVALLVAALHPISDRVTTYAGIGRRSRLGHVTTRTVTLSLSAAPAPLSANDTESRE